MKKIYEFRMLIGFIILVLGVTFLNSLSMKKFIKEENTIMNENFETFYTNM